VAVTVLSTHHKGGVGKTELAIHVTGALVKGKKLARTLLVDCDGQASAWKFFFKEAPKDELKPRDVDDSHRLSAIWNPDRASIKRNLEAFDYIVLDLDAPLEHTVQTIVQASPNLILIPVNPQAEALTNLADPLNVIAQLEKKAGHSLRTRIVPLGTRVADIRKQVEAIQANIQDLAITRRMRLLDRLTNQARRERKYIWEYETCEDLLQYYQDLALNAGP
jgi:cellulose biosynthesis protein BcsQ